MPRSSLNKQLQDFMRQEQLPSHYLGMIEVYIKPLAIFLRSRKQQQPLIVGVNGAQGSGKSTLCQILAILLEDMGCKVAILSLDDLYLPQYQRLELAKAIHPLFQTRGVPGTHDVALGVQTLQSLLQVRSTRDAVYVPRFDKKTDNLKPKNQWLCCSSDVDIILFEGWCVATPAQPEEALIQPVNQLESIEDKDGVWRHHVNQRLKTDYAQLFSLIDVLLFIQVPSFDKVYDWREQQERLTFKNSPGQAMNKNQLIDFIQYFERLTQYSLETLPALADVVLLLNTKQQVVQVNYR